MIDVESLTFSYPGARAPAVRDASFRIPRGEILGFLGPSGAGKSTTQKVLIGLLKGYAGSVRVMGRELREWGPEYYDRIGVGFETPNHYLKLTGLENLEYFASLHDRPCLDPSALLARVGLADAAGQRVGEYSKGMRVRLSFARALLHDPDVLFLDEPTSGLDPVNARTIKDIVLERRAAGATVFLTTHNMQVAEELCDRVAFIVDGEIKLLDAPKALKLRYGRRDVEVEYDDGGKAALATFPLDGLGANDAFLRVLRERDVRTVHTKETTLDDVFIAVTGRTLA